MTPRKLLFTFFCTSCAIGQVALAVRLAARSPGDHDLFYSRAAMSSFQPAGPDILSVHLSSSLDSINAITDLARHP
jgi:hypothetical protein